MSSVLRQKEFFWGGLLNVANVGLMAGGMIQQSGQAKEQAKQAEVQAQKMDAQNAALNRIARTQGGNPNASVQMAQAMQERVRDFSEHSIMSRRGFRKRQKEFFVGAALTAAPIVAQAGSAAASGISGGVDSLLGDDKKKGKPRVSESLFSDIFREKYFGRFPGFKGASMMNRPTPGPNKTLASVMSGTRKTPGQLLSGATGSGSTKLTTTPNVSYTSATPTKKGAGTITLGTTTANSSWSGPTNTANMKTPGSVMSGIGKGGGNRTANPWGANPGGGVSNAVNVPKSPSGNSIMSKTPTNTNKFTSGTTQNSFKTLDVNNLSYNGNKLTPTRPGNNGGGTGQHNPVGNNTSQGNTQNNTTQQKQQTGGGNNSWNSNHIQQAQASTGGTNSSTTGGTGRLKKLGGKLVTAGKWAGGLAAAGTLAAAGAGLYYTKKAFDDD